VITTANNNTMADGADGRHPPSWPWLIMDNGLDGLLRMRILIHNTYTLDTGRPTRSQPA
jgi:hypothetical protein